MISYFRNVEKGAFFLDSVYQKWYEAIDLEILNLEFGDCCILGQLYGRFNRERIESLKKEWGFDEKDFDDYAFDLPDGEDVSNEEFEALTEKEKRITSLCYKSLTAAWKSTILMRLSNDLENEESVSKGASHCYV